MAEKVLMLFGECGIGTAMGRTLTAIEPGARRATFATANGMEEVDYDNIHVIPPQRAPDVIRQSGLS